MYTEQILKNSWQLTLIMEYYGIRIEDAKEVGDMPYSYISVPEFSTLEVEDQEMNAKIKTADGLISLAKDMLIKMQIDTCKGIDDDEDWIQYVKYNASDWFKLYAKVRKGEVWTEEMAKARLNEFMAELREAKEYKEVQL